MQSDGHPLQIDTLMRLTPPDQRAQTRAKASRLLGEAATWCDCAYLALGTQLLRNLSVTVTMIAPNLGHDSLALLLRYSLWCYLLDDLLDRRDTTMSTLDQTERSLRATLRTGLATRQDDLETELAAVLAISHEHDSAGRLSQFRDEIGDGATAALEHARLSRRAARRHKRVRPPTAEQYLDTASRHIHYRSFAQCLLLLSGAEVPQTAMELVDEALTAGSRAVRLVNDLRTARKDSVEGSLNILRLRSRAGRRTNVRQVEQRIAHHARVHNVLIEAAHAAGLPAHAALLLTNSLRVAVGVYQITDLAMEEAWPRHHDSAAPPDDAFPQQRRNVAQNRSPSTAPSHG